HDSDTVGSAKRTQHPACLGPGLVEFMAGAGVGHDAGTGAETQLPAFHFRAADQDVQVQIAVTVDPAHRPGVAAAALALQFGDDLHAAHLRAAGNGAAGESRADHVARRDLRAQTPPHVADDVVHVGVAFHSHQLVHLDTAGDAYPAQVVALEVDQHDVLGALLGVADQLADPQGFVITTDPRLGTGDR